MRPLYILLLFSALACKAKTDQVKRETKDSPFSIEIKDEKLKYILSDTADITTIARGFSWSEGTLWLKDQQALIFSDVPENKIYKWTPPDKLEVWLEPSGYTGDTTLRREGSNGLIINDLGQLILCQHGDRRIALMDASLDTPAARFTSLAHQWRDKRFNSPNDAAIHAGQIYFTDPPYGLPKQDEDPEKEIGFSGVYRIGDQGVVVLLEDGLSRPNGIGFSPDGSFMYVANSDPDNAVWMKYLMNGNSPGEGKLLYNATNEVPGTNGLPDGLKIHPTGYVFATGPGGIWIFSPDDQLAGRIFIPQATANCAFDDTYQHLYVAADSTVLQIDLVAAHK